MFNSLNDREPQSAQVNLPRARQRKTGRRRVAAALGVSVFACWALACTGTSAEAASGSGGKLGYNRDIRPILSDTCFACHGPDKNKRKGKLRLDVREAALEKKAVVP